MFEVGFQELLLISVIALVVLGPERLPKLLSQVGRWAGKARSMARQFREQLESEVNLDDLAKPSPPRSAQADAPSYPPPGEAPPNEPSMSDSLSTAHMTPAEQPATATTDDTYSHAHETPAHEPTYYPHPEGDVYGGTVAAEPEVLTPEEPAQIEEPAAAHGQRV